VLGHFVLGSSGIDANDSFGFTLGQRQEPSADLLVEGQGGLIEASLTKPLCTSVSSGHAAQALRRIQVQHEREVGTKALEGPTRKGVQTFLRYTAGSLIGPRRILEAIHQDHPTFGQSRSNERLHVLETICIEQQEFDLGTPAFPTGVGLEEQGPKVTAQGRSTGFLALHDRDPPITETFG